MFKFSINKRYMNVTELRHSKTSRHILLITVTDLILNLFLWLFRMFNLYCVHCVLNQKFNFFHSFKLIYSILVFSVGLKQHFICNRCSSRGIFLSSSASNRILTLPQRTTRVENSSRRSRVSALNIVRSLFNDICLYDESWSFRILIR